MKERTKEELHRIRCENLTTSRMREIIDQLNAEIEKPKVWDGAPDYCAEACVNFVDKSGNVVFSQEYTRALPKTRAREIAEETICSIHSKTAGHMSDDLEYLARMIEAAILRREKELEEGR